MMVKDSRYLGKPELVGSSEEIKRLQMELRALRQDKGAEIAGLQGEIERLTAQLPDGMKHCTILFKECAVGHGRLTVTNWIDHGCQQCKIERLQALLIEVRAERWTTDLLHRIDAALGGPAQSASLERMTEDDLIRGLEDLGLGVVAPVQSTPAVICPFCKQRVSETCCNEQNHKDCICWIEVQPLSVDPKAQDKP